MAYLARIDLPTTLASAPASLDLLATLLMANLTNIPYDTTALHLPAPEWSSANTPVRLSSGDGMPLGKPNFDRVIHKRTGGYCYSLNTLFASLLRGFGFGVSEVGARVYMHRGLDPTSVGYLWSCITHEALIIDWPGSGDARYLVDVGFGGGGLPYPILLKSGATSPSLSSTESFQILYDPLPGADLNHRDVLPGWTLYRRVLPPNTHVIDHKTASEGEGYWTPCYFFNLSTLSPIDIKMANFYNEKSPDAPWTSVMATSILVKGSGARKTFLGPMIREEDGRTMAKLWTKEGIKGEEKNVLWVEFETSAVVEVLEREFGFTLRA